VGAQRWQGQGDVELRPIGLGRALRGEDALAPDACPEARAAAGAEVWDARLAGRCRASADIKGECNEPDTPREKDSS